MTIIARNAETEELERRYASGAFELGVVYGRRRVGKTTLISEFVKDKPCVFFSALRTSAQENLSFLSAAILQALQPEMEGAAFPSFQVALERVFDAARDRRLVLVIDEYPYLVRAYEGISSLLQHLIDRNKGASRLLVILCGSSMSQMEEEFSASNRPLYGRKTFQLKVRPFGFFGMRGYFAKTDPALVPSVYGVYGGVPKYFEGYREGESLRDNIVRDYLSISAPLLDEPESILLQEVRETSNYNTVFSAIAKGSAKYREIAARAKLESGNIARYLDNLVSLDLIRRETPAYVDERKRTLYSVADNMLRFWYRFVAPSLSLVNSNKPQLAYRGVEDGLDQYMGSVFESICQEYLWRTNGSDLLPLEFTDAGRWWGSDAKRRMPAEIDILAHDGDKAGLFCECKWSRSRVGEDILARLEEKSLLPEFSAIRSRHLCLFSRSGFTEGCRRASAGRGDVTLLSLDDILRP
ncbi:MAG: ATP-binding protein [Coriobacteriales bacterium]|jgi:AAA+ ATPase superfamily predicted ATPase|nr:ATP-binding protein [Coriobacteriales bacterium]